MIAFPTMILSMEFTRVRQKRIEEMYVQEEWSASEDDPMVWSMPLQVLCVGGPVHVATKQVTGPFRLKTRLQVSICANMGRYLLTRILHTSTGEPCCVRPV